MNRKERVLTDNGDGDQGVWLKGVVHGDVGLKNEVAEMVVAVAVSSIARALDDRQAAGVTGLKTGLEFTK